MNTWAWVAAAYGAVLVLSALVQPIRRRTVAAAGAVAYALVALAAGTLVDLFWINLLVPGGLLLTGYWLSGFFFRDPQPWLENWLLRVDGALAADRWMAVVPRPVREFLELCYALDYALIGGGAIYAATIGMTSISHYWTLVLFAELTSYAALPWLRSRPPRALSAPREVAAASLRRLNTAILDHASVQANTLPSGHVAGAVAAALAVWEINPAAGGAMMIMAGLIAIAAIAGRYHYAVDCVAGAIVAAVSWSLM